MHGLTNNLIFSFYFYTTNYGIYMTNTFNRPIRVLVAKAGIDDVLVTGGGIIPQDDMDALKKIGVGELFPPGTNTKDIVKYISDWVHLHRNF